jgi:hypothetical protein
MRAAMHACARLVNSYRVPPGWSRGEALVPDGGDQDASIRSESCPISGRFVADGAGRPQYQQVLEVPTPVHDDLIDHLVRSTSLQRGEAVRIVMDVLAYFDETTEEFVRRRHRELQSKGLTNTDIFARISEELPHRTVAPPSLSLRQLRRIVYG